MKNCTRLRERVFWRRWLEAEEEEHRRREKRREEEEGKKKTALTFASLLEETRPKDPSSSLSNLHASPLFSFRGNSVLLSGRPLESAEHE